jgi:hypothetical protein
MIVAIPDKQNADGDAEEQQGGRLIFSQRLSPLFGRRAAPGKVFWFFFSKKNRFALVFKKEPLRFGFQKRTASLWFSKKNRFALVYVGRSPAQARLINALIG